MNMFSFGTTYLLITFIIIFTDVKHSCGCPESLGSESSGAGKNPTGS